MDDDAKAAAISAKLDSIDRRLENMDRSLNEISDHTGFIAKLTKIFLAAIALIFVVYMLFQHMR